MSSMNDSSIMNAENGINAEDNAIDVARSLSDEDANIDDADVFDEGEYLSIPRIPEQYRASDIIGRRTQASSASTSASIGKIRPKAKLREIWNGLSDCKKYIMMLISEHRHMTHVQLSVMIVNPSLIRSGNAFDPTRTYFEWIANKYRCSLSYAKTFSTKTNDGLAKHLRGLCDAGLLEKIVPAYGIEENKVSDRVKQAPALFTSHYYLTPLGARVLICNTDINRTTSKIKPIGFVPTYKHAAYQTILHEAECIEIMCSAISCAQYASNPDDGKDYGFFDVCRFYHEKDVEEKDVEYKGKKIDFKSDGKMTMYVSSISNFLDWYIEYDSGSSTKDKIKHKTEAFVKYIFWKRHERGDGFRKPILLLVTQKPADLFPQLFGRKRTTYTTAIKNMTKEFFSDYSASINDIARVLIADCDGIRNCGTLGACWHRVDLVTGIASMESADLITASTDPSFGLELGS